MKNTNPKSVTYQILAFDVVVFLNYSLWIWRRQEVLLHGGTGSSSGTRCVDSHQARGNAASKEIARLLLPSTQYMLQNACYHLKAELWIFYQETLGTGFLSVSFFNILKCCMSIMLRQGKNTHVLNRVGSGSQLIQGKSKSTHVLLPNKSIYIWSFSTVFCSKCNKNGTLQF